MFVGMLREVGIEKTLLKKKESFRIESDPILGQLQLSGWLWTHVIACTATVWFIR